MVKAFVMILRMQLRIPILEKTFLSSSIAYDGAGGNGKKKYVVLQKNWKFQKRFLSFTPAPS